MVRSNKQYDVSDLQKCNHAETATLIIPNLKHGAQHGHESAFSTFDELQQPGHQYVWIDLDI